MCSDIFKVIGERGAWRKRSGREDALIGATDALVLPQRYCARVGRGADSDNIRNASGREYIGGATTGEGTAAPIIAPTEATEAEKEPHRACHYMVFRLRERTRPRRSPPASCGAKWAYCNTD